MHMVHIHVLRHTYACIKNKLNKQILKATPAEASKRRTFFSAVILSRLLTPSLRSPSLLTQAYTSCFYLKYLVLFLAFKPIFVGNAHDNASSKD